MLETELDLCWLYADSIFIPIDTRIYANGKRIERLNMAP